jgi:CubicO group peptidase (beta-lactamase class C family)
MRTVFVLLLGLFCAAGFGQASSMSDSLWQNLQNISLADVPADAPGIAAAVIADGQVLFQQTGGYASLTDSTLITPATRFNIASNAKQFTALAILWMEDAGKLSLKDDLRSYFPDILKGISDPITIQHLLTHRSGIRDVYDLLSLQGITWWEHTYDNQDVIDLLSRQDNLNFTPGADYSYSNSNYILLAEIIAKVSGKTFVEVTDDLFAKLGMTSTSFVDDHTQIAEPIALPYFNFGTWSEYDWIWNVCGDGNLFASLDDLIRWEQIVQDPAMVDFPTQIIQKSLELPGDPAIGTYGFGLGFDTYRGMDYVFHEGATGAWKASMVRFPNRKLAFLTLTNSGKTIPYSQNRAMVGAVLKLGDSPEAYATEPADPGTYVSQEEVLGTYLDEGGSVFQLIEQEGDLYLRRYGRNDTKLVREADNIFHQWNDPDFKQEFTTNAKGEMEVTAYYWSHAPYTLTRPKVDWSGFDTASLDGSFYNVETDVTIQVRHQEGKQYQIVRGDRESTGLLITPTRMIVNNYRLQWPEPGSQVDHFLLFGDRIGRVHFRRKP